ncbi:hypothetical protein D515_04709 [Grimontia indica]|uniref:Uncharacterized protein n=1 Tax=Grimontia indica TaxID=1056512 RepID=R1IHY8_9GAMM|nr:hypothetical protein D515_04709 [Grimontia indica]
MKVVVVVVVVVVVIVASRYVADLRGPDQVHQGQLNLRGPI